MLLHILLALSLQTPGLAQPPTAVVNVQRLIAESTLGKAATARLRAFQAEQRAEEEHIGIIFEVPHQTIVWVSPAIDVTSKVIERLEAALKPKP